METDDSLGFAFVGPVSCPDLFFFRRSANLVFVRMALGRRTELSLKPTLSRRRSGTIDAERVAEDGGVRVSSDIVGGG